MDHMDSDTRNEDAHESTDEQRQPSRRSQPSENAVAQTDPEVRLELTQAGVRQVLALYAEERGGRKEFEFTLTDLIRAISKYRSKLLLSLSGFVLLATFVLLFSTPLYTVTTQVVLEQQDPTEAAVNSGRSSSAFIATQAQIFQSRSVVGAAIESLPASEDAENSLESALEALQASAVSGTQVVALSYIGPDPVYGGELLTAIVAAYRDKLRIEEKRIQDQRLTAREGEFAILQDEIVNQEAELNALRLEHFQGRSGTDAIGQLTQLVADQTQTLNDVRQQRIELEKQLIAGAVADDPTVRGLQERLLEAEAEAERARRTLRAGHPSIDATKSEAELLRRQLSRAAAASPNALKRDIEAIKAVEDEMAQALRLEQLALTEAETTQRKEQRLLDEIQQTRALIDERRRALLDQRLLSHLALSGEIGVTARLIEAPVQPLSPTWPNIPLVLLVALILGGAVGSLWAIWLYRENDLSGSIAGQRL